MAPAISGALSLNDCMTVALANPGLISGNADDAAKLKALNPPSDVSSAIDTLVDAGGLKLDGSNQDKAMAASTTVTDWVSAVCPKS
jgi:hypothetical protein